MFYVNRNSLKFWSSVCLIWFHWITAIIFQIVQVVFVVVDARMLLWHGSRLSNWVGILSQGLRVAPPEAPVTGYMVRLRDILNHTNNINIILAATITTFFVKAMDYNNSNQYNFFNFSSPSSLVRGSTLQTCHLKVPITALPVRRTTKDSCCWARLVFCI